MRTRNGIAISRRLFLALGTGIATAQCRQTSASELPLTLTPPDLKNPQLVKITANGGKFQLGEGDHLVMLPHERVNGSVEIDGRGLARHVIIIGGHIECHSNYDPLTMLLNDGSDFAVYTEIGFRGATGGSFKIRCEEKTGRYSIAPAETDALPFDADAQQIKMAIEKTLGLGACHSVTGSGIGGPWKVVPHANAALGRVSLITKELEGSYTELPRSNRYLAAVNALTLKNWRGVCHAEGLLLGGDWQNDGINIDNRYADAIFQGANLHSRGFHHRFHDDWTHPDGFQAYRGPSKLFVERSDFLAKGGNAFIAQPNTVKGLERLYDWWYSNVQFRAYKSDDDQARLSDGSTSFFATLRNTEWRQLMTNCFASRWSWSSQTQITGDPISKYNSGAQVAPPNGLSVRSTPGTSTGYFCSPELNQCGTSYISPGYSHATLPNTKERAFVATRKG